MSQNKFEYKQKAKRTLHKPKIDVFDFQVSKYNDFLKEISYTELANIEKREKYK